MKKLICLALILILVGIATAHQPRLPTEDTIKIENPEISQAFYTELTGTPHTYILASEEPFQLYLGILVPAIENIDKDYLLEVSREHDDHEDEDFKLILDATDSDWPLFHEEFAGDDYYWGQEFGSNAPLETPAGVEVEEGTYTIKVSSPDNQGKYVFVVGYKEEFPLAEMYNALVSLPKIKSYFGKSILTSFNNRIGLYLLITLIILAAIILAIIFIIKNAKRKVITLTI